ncbi:MAG: TraB/GumN family protein [Parachlamydiaceae bacterium]|nr:TraB/GumN family protein [Parachlamydiaceae bacterium]
MKYIIIPIICMTFTCASVFAKNTTHEFAEKPLPLKIDFYETDFGTKKMQEVLDQQGELEELYISGLFPKNLDLINLFFSGSFPNLKKLSYNKSILKNWIHPVSFAENLVELSLRHSMPRSDADFGGKKALVKAISNANERFIKAYNRANIFTHFFWNVMSVSGFSLVAAHQQLIDKFVSKAAENYQGNLSQLIEEKDRFNPQKSEILEMVTQEAIKNIENSSKNKGFIYTVINSQKVTSYLIGTLHRATYQMTQNQKMIHAVTNSTELITELGKILLSKLIHEAPIDICDKLRYSIDLPLTELAEKNNITLTALESVRGQINALNNAHIESQTTPNSLHSLYIQKHKLYALYELIELWQEGNEDKLIEAFGKMTHPSVQRIIVDDRTADWSPGLIQKLKRTTTPLTIVVGAGHCIGNLGLAQLFRNADLQVEQM